MNQGQVVVEKLKIKEAESQYEIIKARCKIDENKLKEINFQQSIEIKKNNHRVLFPVVHKNCQYINTPDHICGCLAQIIQNSHDLTKCGQLSLANQNDLQVPVIPYFAAQSVHQNTDIVSIIQGFIMNKILRPAQYIKPLSDPKPQQLFREMMNRKDDCNNFSNRIKMDDRYKQLEGFEFYAACLFDWVKLNIPMRFKTCNHIECFDMTSIVFRLENEILKQKNVQEQNRKYDKITCGFNVDGSYCPSFCVGTYENMIAELVIDYELMDAIRKSEQEAYKFVYIKQNTLILDELTYANKQQLLKQGNAKIKIKQIDSINIQPTSLKIGDYSIIQVMNLRNRQAAVQKQTQFQKYQDIEIELICPISQKPIQYPGRCSLCPQQQCADIKSMIEDFNIKKINQKDSFFRCPLCKMEQKKRYCGLVPQNVYYFDEFIMGIIMQKRNPNSSKLIYKGSQVLLNEYQQQHRILKEQIQDLYPKKRVQYSKLVCCVSNKLLKDPLIIRDCQEYTRVSFESFFNLYKLHGYLEDANKQIIICKCMGCNQSGITRIDQLAYDQMLAEALEVYNKLGPQQKKKINIEEEITYDYSTKELIDDPNKIKKVKYPTNPVHRGFLSEMTSEEFEEYAKQFEPQLIDGKVIQLNQIQVNQFGIKQVQNSQGVFVQNKQEMLDQYNTVGKSDQFNKWGLQINDVKVNYKKKNVDDSEQNI